MFLVVFTRITYDTRCKIALNLPRPKTKFFLKTNSRLDNCLKYILLTWTALISQFVHPVGGEGVDSLPATSFTLLDYMIIWCKIQVIINPLLQLTLSNCADSLSNHHFFSPPGFWIFRIPTITARKLIVRKYDF